MGDKYYYQSVTIFRDSSRDNLVCGKPEPNKKVYETFNLFIYNSPPL